MADLWIDRDGELLNMRYVVSMYRTETDPADIGPDDRQYFGIRVCFEDAEQRLFTFKDKETRDQKWALIRTRLSRIVMK